MPEVAEPPVEQKPVIAPPMGAVTVDLSNLGKKAAGKTEVEVKPPVETPPVEVKPPETKVDPVIAPPKPSDKEHNMAELRKAREAAEEARKALEAEHNKLKTEFEEFRNKPSELPEDVKGKLSKAEQLEKELQEARQRLRQTDLAQDPEFQAKYNKPIMDRITTMGQTALAAGVSEADWKNAVANWDENQFGEWSESMPPAQRVKFMAAWTAAVDLSQQQQAELKNADTALQELQKKRQADQEQQQKQYFTQNEQLAKTVMSEFIKPETLKEYEDLGPAAEAILMKAARHELTAKDIFTQLAGNQVLARVVPKQAARITELETALAERDKKIAEQDAFIANQAGAVPRGDAAGSSAAAQGDNTPLWKQVVVKTPG